MAPTHPFSPTTLRSDFSAGLVVFLVALPLCLGVALASNAPLFSGLLTGIIGGIVVGSLSGSQTSVSGPSPGITAIVAAQILVLGSFQAFSLAVVIAGLIQIALGAARAGFIAAFFPSSVIKGLLASIGIILILKQVPHLFGVDPDPEGDMAFQQFDHESTFSELGKFLDRIQPLSAVIGLLSIAVLVMWDKWNRLKKSPIPAPLVVVFLGAGLSLLIERFGGPLYIEPAHRVTVPVSKNLAEFVSLLQFPDFSQWLNPAVYTAALTVAAVASLETLLNLEAVDKIDPQQRKSPASRELCVQGIGNVVLGLVGGLPATSAIVRSSVNINAGSKTKLSTIIHGILLLGSVMLLPAWLNEIPLSCLAAILLMTGTKLASPALFKQMWSAGRYQFLPFVLTVVAIVFTDLLVGVVIGLVVSIAFILNSNLRRPIRRRVEKHLGGDVLRIELANQVSFLNRAALSKVFDDLPAGGHVLLDADDTDYIDPDILDLIRDFKEKTAPARGIEVSFLGFRTKYQFRDQVQYVDYSTRELQATITPAQVLQVLKDGNERFRTGHRLTRDLGRQVAATTEGQHPLAVVLSCIDSRSPAELIFDLGLGDIFSVRVAGNVAGPKVLGSMEYACAVAGVKLILVMGHTRCGAVATAVSTFGVVKPLEQITGCQNVEPILREIQAAIDRETVPSIDQLSAAEREAIVDRVARSNVNRTVRNIPCESQTLRRLLDEERISIVGALYDVATGNIEFLSQASAESGSL
jgi:carbonic anhydrase/SulP family sulfate permease